jgi:integrase
MAPLATQQSKVGKIANPPRPSPNSRKYAQVRVREYLLPIEVESMRDALKKASGRHAHRDSTLILLMYRHGLRVAEAVALRWEQIDWSSGNLHVKRVKQGTPSTQPLYGEELRSRSQASTKLSSFSLYFPVSSSWSIG